MVQGSALLTVLINSLDDVSFVDDRKQRELILKRSDLGPERHRKSRIVGHPNRKFNWTTCQCPTYEAPEQVDLGVEVFIKAFPGEEAF